MVARQGRVAVAAGPWGEPMRVSVILPALNEEPHIGATLKCLQRLRAHGHQVIVVDGGSTDATLQIARPLADRIARASAGRAQQMNVGAAQATGDVFWFLHADTRVPQQADELILRAIEDRGGWGRFDVRLSGHHPLLRIIERCMNVRSRISGIATGDQGIFIRRGLFEQLGGFADIPLMEDVDLSRRLKNAKHKPVCLRQTVITSSRRWEQRGILRTVVLMWYLRLAYFLGVPADRLAARYE